MGISKKEALERAKNFLFANGAQRFSEQCEGIADIINDIDTTDDKLDEAIEGLGTTAKKCLSPDHGDAHLIRMGIERALEYVRSLKDGGEKKGACPRCGNSSDSGSIALCGECGWSRHDEYKGEKPIATTEELLEGEILCRRRQSRELYIRTASLGRRMGELEEGRGKDGMTPWERGQAATLEKRVSTLENASLTWLRTVTFVDGINHRLNKLEKKSKPKKKCGKRGG